MMPRPPRAQVTNFERAQSADITLALLAEGLSPEQLAEARELAEQLHAARGWLTFNGALKSALVRVRREVGLL